MEGSAQANFPTAAVGVGAVGPLEREFEVRRVLNFWRPVWGELPNWWGLPPAVENVILEHLTWQETFACVSAARSNHVLLFELSSAGGGSDDESSAGTSSTRAEMDVESCDRRRV